VSGDPLQSLYSRSPEFAARIRELVAEKRFDAVHAFMLRTAQYVPLAATASVLDAMDSMQLRMQRNVLVERPPKRWLYREELRRVARYEPTVGTSVSEIVVVSPEDAVYFPEVSVHVVPNGVDTETFVPAPRRQDSPVIVF